MTSALAHVVTIAIVLVFWKWVSNNRIYFRANQHTKISIFWNLSSRWWFVHSPQWKTNCLVALQPALIASVASGVYSSVRKCCHVTQWKHYEIHHFSRRLSSLLILPWYLYNRFLCFKSTPVKTWVLLTCVMKVESRLLVACQAAKQFTGSGFTKQHT